MTLEELDREIARLDGCGDEFTDCCAACPSSMAGPWMHWEYLKAVRSARRPGIAYVLRAKLHRLTCKHADPFGILDWTNEDIHDGGTTPPQYFTAAEAREWWTTTGAGTRGGRAHMKLCKICKPQP